MMQHKQFKLALIGWLLPMLLAAQPISEKHSIVSVQVGPSWQVSDLMGITDYTGSYRKGLRDGVSWNAGYNYLFGHSRVQFVLGALYQGSRYSNSLPNSSDELFYHYIAPQVGVNVSLSRWDIRLVGCPGYMWYRDNSTVYDKSRRVKQDMWAVNFALSGGYRITSSLGVSATLGWICATPESYSVHYHGETWQVGHPSFLVWGEKYNLSQLSLSFGLNYYF